MKSKAAVDSSSDCQTLLSDQLGLRLQVRVLVSPETIPVEVIKRTVEFPEIHNCHWDVLPAAFT